MTAPGNSPLAGIARRLRARAVELSAEADVPHLGSSLSCIDILVAAYWGGVLAVDPADPVAEGRDRIILSKGHAATALFAVLAERGFFPPELLKTYNTDGAVLAEHPGPACVPGVEAATGSLGHGLPMGIGMAAASRIRGLGFKVLVVMSDGECNEGSVWEGALLAPALGLDNLIAVIDFNRWQATGRSTEVTALVPLVEKWRAFGWHAEEVDGHDPAAIADFYARAASRGDGKPSLLVAHTVKGKGVSFMEDDNNWHYRIPKPEEVARAKAELGVA